MSIALLVITDGRDDYLARCVHSFETRIDTSLITERYMFDDTGNSHYRRTLADRYPRFEHIHGGRRQGFGGAIRSAWSHLWNRSHAEWVLHIEQDFVLTRDVDLAAMIAVMVANSRLAQMALRRQAWSDAEHAAGGVIEQHPEAYADVADGQGRQWLEHRQFWTTNPSIYRRWITQMGWPAGARSEGVFTHRLLNTGAPGIPASQLTFGYWGARDSGVWAEHIGEQRVGNGY